MASIPMPGGRSLRPVKNRGTFFKGVDENFPLIFHFAIYTLNRTKNTALRNRLDEIVFVSAKLRKQTKNCINIIDIL